MIYEMENALFKLRKTLASKYKIKFPNFDLAYAVYWKRTHPQQPLNKNNFPLMDEGSLFANFVSTVQDLPYVNLLPNAAKVYKNLTGFVSDWWLKQGKQTLRDLALMEPTDIANRLPAYWAKNTYEALWGDKRIDSMFFSRDKWVRELSPNYPEFYG